VVPLPLCPRGRRGRPCLKWRRNPPLDAVSVEVLAKQALDLRVAKVAHDCSFKVVRSAAIPRLAAERTPPADNPVAAEISASDRSAA
jgi:hypothetical protein